MRTNCFPYFGFLNLVFTTSNLTNPPIGQERRERLVEPIRLGRFIAVATSLVVRTPTAYWHYWYEYRGTFCFELSRGKIVF